MKFLGALQPWNGCFANPMESVAFPFWSLWLHSAATAATTTSYEGLSVGASLASVPKQPSRRALR